jgi:hypothetical protein
VGYAEDYERGLELQKSLPKPRRPGRGSTERKGVDTVVDFVDAVLASPGVLFIAIFGGLAAVVAWLRRRAK